jgi:hypothetical protein
MGKLKSHRNLWSETLSEETNWTIESLYRSECIRNNVGGLDSFDVAYDKSETMATVNITVNFRRSLISGPLHDLL